MILPARADQIASITDQIVNMESKWIGLKRPTNLNEWIQKLLTLTNNINETQTYPMYLCERVPLGCDNWMPPNTTAMSAA